MNKVKLPFYAVILNSKLYDIILGYEEAAKEMYDSAKSQSVFLKFKNTREKLEIILICWKLTMYIA